MGQLLETGLLYKNIDQTARLDKKKIMEWCINEEKTGCYQI